MRADVTRVFCEDVCVSERASERESYGSMKYEEEEEVVEVRQECVEPLV